MSADWEESALGELCHEITVGYVGSMTTEYRESGIPFFRSKNISEYELDWNDIKYVSCDFHKKLKKSALKPGDVLVVRTGKPGTTCVIPADVERANCSDVVIIRVNPKRLSSHYLSYYMNSAANHQISSRLVGAVQQHFNVGAAKKIVVRAPQVAEQNKIVKILKDLDDKKKLNSQINQTLERMAQAIFKSWFVDFEPVKAKIAAKQRWLAIQPGNEPASPVCYAPELTPEPPQHDLETAMTLAAMEVISGKDEAQLTDLQAEQPEQYAELRATAELFPSAMQESELGEIPVGWSIGTLADLAHLNKHSWTKKTIPCEITYVDLANTKSGVIETTIEFSSDEAPSRARRRLLNGDTIVGTVRPGNRSFAFIKKPSDSLTGSTGFAVLSPKRKALSEFVYIAATSDESISHLAHLADGGAYPAVRPEVVSSLKVTIADDEVIDRFHAYVKACFDLSSELKGERKQLSQLRDTLLPKLLSGELTISNAEERATEVADA